MPQFFLSPQRRHRTHRATINFIAAAALLHPAARAQETSTEGVLGWHYYNAGVFTPPGYAMDPVTACQNTAQHHMDTALVAMRPSVGRDGIPATQPMYECKYPHFLQWVGPQWYGATILFCKDGYVAQWPGMCVKQIEVPRAAACSPDEPGYALGNPVLLSSGAKVQSETDYSAGPGAALQVTRTYRTLRQSGVGQSGGQGWSFWFDRQVTVTAGSSGQAPSRVTGTYGDGSYFEFAASNGVYVSLVDKRDSLQAFGANGDAFAISRADGQVDHFKNIAGSALLLSTHTREGVAQFYAYDADGRLQTISDGNGRTLQVAWHGAVVASIGAADASLRYTYEEAALPVVRVIPGMSKLVAVALHDATGAQVSIKQYHYDDPRNRYLLTGVTDENGVRFATYTFDEQGRVIVSGHANGADRHTFSYPDATTRVVSDPLGTVRTMHLAYAGGTGRLTGRLTGENQPAGAGCSAGASARTFDAGGSITSRTDFNGHKSCFINDQKRGLATSQVAGLNGAAACPASAAAAIGAASRRISTQWHPDWPISTRVARPLEITSDIYNGQADLDGKIVDCAEGAMLPNGKPIAVLCQQTIQTTLDANGSRGFGATPAGAARVWRYSYNGAGQLLTVTGPPDQDGQAASASYVYYADTTESHSKGDLHTATDSLGAVTEYLEYTRAGQASKIRRADGQTLTLHFDVHQRLISSSLENGSGKTAQTSYEYDAVGQLTRRVAPDGSSLRYTYDDAHRLVSLVNGAGDSIAFTLDAIGNVVRQEVRDASGALALEANHSFDALNRKTIDRYGPDNPGIHYEYDAVGNPTKLTDQLGRVTTREYDYFNRLIRETMPAPTPGGVAPVVGYTYNHQDELTQVSDPRKLITRYDIDGFGQRTAVVSPDSGTTTSRFDGAGKQIASRDARGYTTNYDFDAARRLTRVSYVDGTGSQFAYGEAGSGAFGRMTTMRDASGMTVFRYDESGNLLARSYTVAADNGAATTAFTLAYAYGDEDGNFGRVRSMTYPSGNRIDIAYDRAGRVHSLRLAAPGVAGDTTILDNVEYVPFGPVKSWGWGDAAAASPVYVRTFDLAGRMTRYPLGDPAKGGALRTLSYDASGNIVATRHAGAALAARLDQHFSYDGVDRLTGFVADGSSQHYSYDLNGNRTGFGIGAASYVNMIGATSNQLSGTSGPAPAKRNSFDASGNLSSDGTIAYSHDTAGRLIAAKVAGIVTRYVYNGLGQRVIKHGIDGTTFYVYDEMGRLVGEYDGSGKAIEETVYLGDLPVAILKPADKAADRPGNGTVLYRVYADHLQTPRVLTRASDNRIVWRWDNADPFGLDHPDENPGGLGVLTYNRRFPGQVYDKETNNHYNYFRDYDPQTGRYIQSDPISLDGGINTYSHVDGNPISRIDPLGLASCTFTLSSGRIVCAPTASTNSPIDIPAASGNNGNGQQCRNNPTCTATPHHGPIPTGCWRWTTTNGSTTKPNGRVLEPCPGTNTNATEQRTLIRSHSCANPFGPGVGPQYCSEGCVTGTVPDIQNLNHLIDAEPGSTLQVVP